MFIKYKSKHQGFILYESVLALMITIMTLGILQQSLQLLKTIQQTSFRDQLRWHITQEKLQETLSNNEIVTCDENRLVYLDKKTNKKIAIKKYGNINNFTLLLTRDDGKGYVPIITNLRKIGIEKIRNLVIITTENKAGQLSEMFLINDD